MTTFCVFGINHSDCLATARKDIPSGVNFGVRQWTDFTIEQSSVYAELLADHIFNDPTKKPKQISPAFDAPQFAEEWITLAGTQIRDGKIMVKGEKTDINGNPVVRKGKIVIGWIPYLP